MTRKGLESMKSTQSEFYVRQNRYSTSLKIKKFRAKSDKEKRELRRKIKSKSYSQSRSLIEKSMSGYGRIINKRIQNLVSNDAKYESEMLRVEKKDYHANVLGIINKFNKGKKFMNINDVFNQELESNETEDVIHSTIQLYQEYVMSGVQDIQVLLPKKYIDIELDSKEFLYLKIDTYQQRAPLIVSK